MAYSLIEDSLSRTDALSAHPFSIEIDRYILLVIGQLLKNAPLSLQARQSLRLKLSLEVHLTQSQCRGKSEAMRRQPGGEGLCAASVRLKTSPTSTNKRKLVAEELRHHWIPD